MGKPLNQEFPSLNELEKNIIWLQNLMSNCEDSQLVCSNYVTRIKEIFTSIENLNEDFSVLKKCEKKNDYTFSSYEVRYRAFKALCLLRLSRFI